MSLAAAIQRVQVEFDDLAFGTSRAPGEGTADWYYGRALGLGLSAMKRASLVAATDPTGFERFMRAAANSIKASLPEEVS